MSKTTVWVIVGLLIVFLAGFFVYYQRENVAKEVGFITSFEDCVSAGYPVMESYPRQCTTPEGNVYTEELDATDEGVSTATAGEGCYIGGCSQEICSDEPDAVSTCEYRAEYSCYKSARCEKQSNGQCGWTETSALTQCISLKLGEFSK
jgi:hypothetical protein